MRCQAEGGKEGGRRGDASFCSVAKEEKVMARRRYVALSTPLFLLFFFSPLATLAISYLWSPVRPSARPPVIPPGDASEASGVLPHHSSDMKKLAEVSRLARKEVGLGRRICNRNLRQKKEVS